MKAKSFSLVRYDADEGKVFDWKEPHINIDEEGNQVEEHLNVATLFIGANDSITNYVEVDSEGNRVEMEEVVAAEADYVAALQELGVE
jgi:hypothetical protein